MFPPIGTSSCRNVSRSYGTRGRHTGQGTTRDLILRSVLVQVRHSRKVWVSPLLSPRLGPSMLRTQVPDTTFLPVPPPGVPSDQNCCPFRSFRGTFSTEYSTSNLLLVLSRSTSPSSSCKTFLLLPASSLTIVVSVEPQPTYLTRWTTTT